MKKKKFIYAFILMLPFIGNHVNAQNSTSENDQAEIKALQEQLTKEKEKTVYLKEALDIRNSGVEITLDSVTIKLTEVRGNSATNTISAKGLITYHGEERRNLQFVKQQLVDPNGNIIESYKVLKPNDLTKDIGFIEDAEKDIPYGFLLKFEECNEKIPTLSLFRVQIYGSRIGRKVDFNFKGIDVIWD